MRVPGNGNGRSRPAASRRPAARGSVAPDILPARRSFRRRSSFVLGFAALLIAVSQVAVATNGADSDTTDNGAGGASTPVSTGTVTLGDDDADEVMFNMTGMIPGSTATKCINVVYTGSLNASVRLYAANTDGGQIPTYLDLVVERSTGAAGGASHDCTGYVEAGDTNLWTTGTLASFITTHSSYASGIDTWAPAAAPPSKTVSYRFTVTLRDEPSAANKTGSIAFHWESNNL